MLNRIKKMVENTSATPMNPGVVAVGADNQRDMSLGSTERSEWGDEVRICPNYHDDRGRTIAGAQDGNCAIDGGAVTGSRAGSCNQLDTAELLHITSACTYPEVPRRGKGHRPYRLRDSATRAGKVSR